MLFPASLMVVIVAPNLVYENIIKSRTQRARGLNILRSLSHEQFLGLGLGLGKGMKVRVEPSYSWMMI